METEWVGLATRRSTRTASGYENSWGSWRLRASGALPCRGWADGFGLGKRPWSRAAGSAVLPHLASLSANEALTSSRVPMCRPAIPGKTYRIPPACQGVPRRFCAVGSASPLLDMPCAKTGWGSFRASGTPPVCSGGAGFAVGAGNVPAPKGRRPPRGSPPARASSWRAAAASGSRS